MTDLTTHVLIEIRDEIRATRKDLSERIDQTNAKLDETNAKVDQTNAKVDQTNARLDQSNARLDSLEKRQTESEVRLATEIVAVVGAVNQLRDAILEDRELRSTVQGHERRITALEARSS